ncbi:MAG TPA: class I adenylate-forming enzyme family protein [Microlunatus sp.]|nr:class I adenylate-forming enzyme family protein [Microlunatus sp.]
MTGSAANLAELLAVRAEQQPAAVALGEPGGPGLTWRELEQRVAATSAALSAAGLVAGQRVLLALPNSVRLVVDVLACLRAGLVAVPIDPETPAGERDALVDRTGARLVLTGRTQLDQTQLDQTRPDQTRPDQTRDVGPEHDPPGTTADVLVLPPLDPAALAVLLRTAGTSAEAKIAMLSHHALAVPAERLARLGLITGDDVVLAAVPLWHVYGLGVIVGGWLAAGCRLVVAAPDTELGPVVETEGVTVLPAVPAMLERLLREDGVADRLGGLRLVLSAAAPLSDELAAEFAAATGHRIESGYGLTEAAGGVTTTLTSAERGSRRGFGHVGRPMPGVDVRIGDGSDPGEPDRIWIRADHLFSGYWPDGAGGPDPDGWYDTGDLGYLVDGELYLVERSRELITVHGFPVYPAEVEHVLAAHPGVVECAVIGHRAGVIAFVVTRDDVTADQVAEHCAAELPKFKRPAEIRRVDALPRGVTGKIQKSVLRRLLDQDRQSHDRKGAR